MKVKFIQDYRGVLTAEQYYQAGQGANIPSRAALELSARGIVESLAESEPDEVLYEVEEQPKKPEPVKKGKRGK